MERVEAGQRLDLFLVSRVSEFSRSHLQRLIRDELVLLNGMATRAREIVRSGDQVTIKNAPPKPAKLVAEKTQLDVLFEDDDLIVINKPAGMSVHPGAGQNSGTLVNALLAHCRNLSGIGGLERPGIVHRLDKETSGCLVVAKNDAAHLSLAKQFAARTVQKIYLALVAGKMRGRSGTIDAPIKRHRVHRKKMAIDQRGRASRTDFRVLRSSAAATLLECKLHSGRTHQIRVHLQHLGHPVLGDKIYGGRSARNFPRQMLHAWKLGFNHPRTTARLEFATSPPMDFQETAVNVGIAE